VVTVVEIWVPKVPKVPKEIEEIEVPEVHPVYRGEMGHPVLKEKPGLLD